MSDLQTEISERTAQLISEMSDAYEEGYIQDELFQRAYIIQQNSNRLDSLRLR